jgi:hypothetical protein
VNDAVAEEHSRDHEHRNQAGGACVERMVRELIDGREITGSLCDELAC